MKRSNDKQDILSYAYHGLQCISNVNKDDSFYIENISYEFTSELVSIHCSKTSILRILRIEQ